MAHTETITDPEVALARCGDLFVDDPIVCNMVAASLRPPEPVELLRASADGNTIGTAVRWGDGYTVGSFRDNGLQAIAGALPIDRSFELFGPTGPAADVAGRWTQRCDGTARPVEMMRVYRLGALRAPADTAGQLVEAREDHLDLGAEWSVAFATEIGHDPSPLAAARAQVGRAAAQGRLFIWQVGGEPKAHLLTAVARFGVVRIGAVYTPPNERRHGYAAAMTAAVSAVHLARPDVDTVTLNTQAANAATNRLYRRLGFEPHHEILTVALVPSDAA